MVDCDNNTFFIIDDVKEVLNCCYSVERFKYNNCNNYNFVYIVYGNIRLNVTNVLYPTMMYSKILKLININSGVTLNDLLYSDLELLTVRII